MDMLYAELGLTFLVRLFPAFSTTNRPLDSRLFFAYTRPRYAEASVACLAVFLVVFEGPIKEPNNFEHRAGARNVVNS